MSKMHKDKNNPFYNKHHTEKFKKMMSKVHKDKKLSNKTKKEISKAMKYKWANNKDYRDKISEHNRNNNPMLGRKHSRESIEKNRESNKRYCEEHYAIMINRIKNTRKKFKDTDIELIMKQILKSIKIKYIHQYNVGNRYIADFYIPNLNLIIECDGTYWHNLEGRKLKDKTQNKLMRNLGYNVLRFNDRQIKKQPNECLEKILKK